MGLQPLTDVSVCNETIVSYFPDHSVFSRPFTTFNTTNSVIGCTVFGARLGVGFNYAKEGIRRSELHQVCVMGKSGIPKFFIVLHYLYICQIAFL